MFFSLMVRCINCIYYRCLVNYNSRIIKNIRRDIRSWKINKNTLSIEEIFDEHQRSTGYTGFHIFSLVIAQNNRSQKFLYKNNYPKPWENLTCSQFPRKQLAQPNDTKSLRVFWKFRYSNTTDRLSWDNVYR